MRRKKIESYRSRARECHRKATAAREKEDKGHWLAAEQRWLTLAYHEEASADLFESLRPAAHSQHSLHG
jgi:hypothetical protein